MDSTLSLSIRFQFVVNAMNSSKEALTSRQVSETFLTQVGTSDCLTASTILNILTLMGFVSKSIIKTPGNRVIHKFKTLKKIPVKKCPVIKKFNKEYSSGI